MAPANELLESACARLAVACSGFVALGLATGCMESSSHEPFDGIMPVSLVSTAVPAPPMVRARSVEDLVWQDTRNGALSSWTMVGAEYTGETRSFRNVVGDPSLAGGSHR